MLNSIFLGLISFFTNLSTEMTYPLISLYLTSVFGATPALVQLVCMRPMISQPAATPKHRHIEMSS